MKISACIITKNEETNLPRCLASIKPVVDEIIVVDSGSTDATRKIAESSGALFIHHDWEGYVGQKNFALAQASHDWILSVDADEELSPALADSLQHLRQNQTTADICGYRVSRIVFYKGRWIRHGDWYPDRLVRLFRKDKAKFSGGHVHELLEVSGKIEPLSGDLHHYTYKDSADRDKRITHYAELWAKSAIERNRKAGPLAAPLHAIARFLRGFIVKGGFLDGAIGLEIATGNAREVYLKYTKLRQLQNTQ